MEKAFEGKYRDILIQYLEHQDEEILYTCEKLSREAMEERVSPEEIVHLHRSVIELYGKELPDFVRLSFDVLLEIMVGYGLAYMEHLSLRTEQKELRSEIAQAEDMQKTLMKTEVPEHDELDFGVISVAARQMSGDYYSFTEEGDKQIGIALADVIGKGIPAAFSISMIKYALAGMTGDDRKPSIVLESLNQVAEENINDNMFITMFYGLYHEDTHLFEYGSAGHELGLYYQHKENSFSDLYAKGLPLGVDKNAIYRQFDKKIEVGDAVFIMSDGVTETRTANGFIEREELTEIIAAHISLSAEKNGSCNL
ncbi:serine phosphatase; controls the activity of the piezosome (stressosome) [Listeria monocytogenes]|nr:serine phosphatase; controls the activity of the piezosome (stressosome) [Listeria monocytogenes]